MKAFDVVILGGGPAGLAAAISAKDSGADVLIVEREDRIGGILKQCVHDGFGLIRFGERLSGPEYAERYISMVNQRDIPVLTSTFAIDIQRKNESRFLEGQIDKAEVKGLSFIITLINGNNGIFDIESKCIILASGCRERTSRQIFIQGTRPSGIYTAGTAQHLVNIEGLLPCKKCVILGSGDIGLIMARRLKLEGADVVGVYEAKKAPSGLSRNIAQCLDDFSTPLYLSHTITKIYGDDRVEAVEICQVDEGMNPIGGTEEKVECDGVILSVGLIPENEMAEKIEITIDPATKGPFVDQDLMTDVPGVFCCGNALHVNDLVDYVSESGEIAGRSAANYSRNKANINNIQVKADFSKFLYVVPQSINTLSDNHKTIFYFRSADARGKTRVEVRCNNKIIFAKGYRSLKPPEMERVEINIDNLLAEGCSSLEIIMMEE